MEWDDATIGPIRKKIWKLCVRVRMCVINELASALINCDATISPGNCDEAHTCDVYNKEKKLIKQFMDPKSKSSFAKQKLKN